MAVLQGRTATEAEVRNTKFEIKAARAFVLQKGQYRHVAAFCREWSKDWARKGQESQAVGINLSQEVVDYFKGLVKERGLPFQKLIDLYVLDCAKKRKKLTMK